MDYAELIFKIEPQSTGMEILIALLSQIGYDSFEETDEGLKAYIPFEQFDINALQQLSIFHSDQFTISYQQNMVKSQNWNEVWERNFSPVIIGDSVYVRAPFHLADHKFNYEIIIEPKMAFGTAHHETTSMMIELMLKEDFSQSRVLDMGCGTGILSILAEMLGAKFILAVDPDEWAYQNTIDNIQKNNCRKISVVKGNADFLSDELFEFILANINRNVLMEDMSVYSRHLVSGGILLLSGFYTQDLKQVEQSAEANGLNNHFSLMKNEWVAAKFIKL